MSSTFPEGGHLATLTELKIVYAHKCLITVEQNIINKTGIHNKINGLE